MSLQKHERAALEAVRAVVEPLGCTVATIIAGGKHGLKLAIVGPRGRRTYAVSSSPKVADHEATYARQWARREVSKVMP